MQSVFFYITEDDRKVISIEKDFFPLAANFHFLFEIKMHIFEKYIFYANFQIKNWNNDKYWKNLSFFL